MFTLYQTCLKFIIKNKEKFPYQLISEKLSQDAIDDIIEIVGEKEKLHAMDSEELINAIDGNRELSDYVLSMPSLMKKLNYRHLKGKSPSEFIQYRNKNFKSYNIDTQQKKDTVDHNIRFNIYLYRFLNNAFVYKKYITHSQKHLLDGLDRRQRAYLAEKFRAIRKEVMEELLGKDEAIETFMKY